MQQLRKYLRPLILSVAIAILIYLAVALSLDWQKSYDAILALSLSAWLIIFALTLVNFVLRAIRWHGYMAYLGHRVPFFRDMAIYFAGFAFTTTPGKVGETVRSVYLKHLNVSYAHSFAALIVERLIDVITMIILSSFCVFAFSAYQLPVALFFLMVAGMLVAIRSERLQTWIAGKVAGLASAKIKTLGEHFIDLLQAIQALLKSGPFLAGLALGLIAWGAEGVVLGIILQGLGVDTSWPVAVGIYSIAILAGAISFIPGGLGSTEAVMGGSLVLLGVEPGTAMAATLICRLVTLWPAVAIGVAFVLMLESTAWAEEGDISDASGPMPSADAQNVRD